MSTPTVHVCYTWGYGGSSLPVLRGLLDSLGAVLVDVRYSPKSWSRQWWGTSLAREFAGRYVWVKALGNTLYRTDDIQLADPARGVEAVAPILAVRPIVMLCVCPIGETCHRAVAARWLAEATGCEIVHLPPGAEANAPQKRPQLRLL